MKFIFIDNIWYPYRTSVRCFIVLLRDVFHIGLAIGPKPAVLAWRAAERQYSRPRTYN
jgi:hypothetical protein